MDRVRAEVLHTKREDLLRFADMLDGLAKGASVCVVGGKKPLSQCGLATTESVSE